VVNEHEKLGFAGRFGAGLPRVNDGSLLFLQHMVSKFEPVAPEQRQFGSRLAIVFNGSPLFTGGAGSGESEIRKWIIEQDWLEAIIALPEQMFYNTGIGTYIWIVTNRKEAQRRGRIQLIDARERYQSMRRSLGDKRRYMGEADIAAVVCEYGKFVDTETCKIFTNETFGYNRVPIERPLRLLYTMNIDRKSRFLDAVPHLLDDIQAIDRELGRTPRENWNEFDQLMTDLLKRRGSKWKKAEQKLFRDVFADVKVEPEIQPVILERRKATGDPNARIWGWFPDPEAKGRVVMYEPNGQLRDFENVRLVEINDEHDNEAEIARYFRDEVQPHVADAWADREKKRSAFEINFNRHFYKYTPPRPLAEIDADIKQMEEEIMRLLREVTRTQGDAERGT